MFRFIVKIAVVALLAYGAYYYFTDGGAGPKNSNLPALSFEEIMSGGEQELEGLKTEEQELEAEVQELEKEGEELEVRDEESLNSPPFEGVSGGGSETEEHQEQEESADSGIPSQINLAVPFTSQAPHSNWSLPYQEACEEASSYMVSEYYKGTASGAINKDTADTAILEAVAFEEDFFGSYLDTTVAETRDFIDMFYGLNARVVENPTVEQIKAEIASGRPVIVPAAGRELNNPNFSGVGPLYHMFVIKGYTTDTFITNDPGTRNGENYIYKIDVIMSAMGDWNQGDPANGAKRVIFISP